MDPIAMLTPVWLDVLVKLPGDQISVAVELLRRSGLPKNRLVELADGMLAKRQAAVSDFSEREVSESLGVGRQVVRDALRTLHKQGLVANRKIVGNSGSVLMLLRMTWADLSVGVPMLYIRDENPVETHPRNPVYRGDSDTKPDTSKIEKVPRNPVGSVPRNPVGGSGVFNSPENSNAGNALRNTESVQLDKRSGGGPSATGSAPKVAPADRAAGPVQASLLPAALSHPGVAAPAAPATKETAGAKRQGRRGATMDGSTRRRKRSEMPTDWAPDEKHAAKAKELGVDLAAELEKFTAYCKASGQMYVEWGWAFRNWLLNARERMQRRPGGPASPTEEVPAFVRRPAAVPTAGLLAPAPTRPTR